MRATAVVALMCVATCCRTSNHATAWAFSLNMGIGNRYFPSLSKLLSNSNSFGAILFIATKEVIIVITPTQKFHGHYA